MRAKVITVCCLVACAPVALMAQINSASQTAEQSAVTRTIADALKAAEDNDLQAFKSHLMPDFYMYDAGQRYDAAGIVDRLKQVQQSGARLQWHVTAPDVRLYGTTAWIAYVNDGSVTTQHGTTERKWLESAFLVKIAGVWKVAFWHSTPVPPQPPEH